MRIFMLGWCGLVDLDRMNIPLGVFRTEEEAMEATRNIGPDMCSKGVVTLYRTAFPGFFMGAIPIMDWRYETFFDESEIERGKLSDLKIIEGR